jgi:rod shape-determining protein MreD
MRSIYLSIPIMLVLAVIQATILPKFSILGFVPLLVLLVAVSWGLLHTLEEGVVWAFVGGFFIDLFSIGPLGVTSLASMAAVTAVMLIKRNFPESRVILPILLSFLATLVFWFIYLLVLRLAVPLIINTSSELGIIALTEGTRSPGLLSELGQYYSINRETFGYGLLMSFGHGLLILPIYWAIYIIERLLVPRRVEI